MGLIDPADKEKLPSISKEKQAYCFKCGQCEAFCKSGALKLDYDNHLIPEKAEFQIHPHDLSQYVKNRRTIRHYKDEKVSRELIEKIMDTVRYSASGSNIQNTGFYIYSNREDIRKISALTVEWMESILNTPHPMAKYVGGVVQLWHSGVDFISHNAPHLLIAHIPYNPYVYDPTDAVIALTHFDILAPSFGLGTCWAGFIKMAVDSYEPLRKHINPDSDKSIVYPMLFGYPVYKAYHIPERKEAQIEWR